MSTTKPSLLCYEAQHLDVPQPSSPKRPTASALAHAPWEATPESSLTIHPSCPMKGNASTAFSTWHQMR